jgi:hypothetical protein
MVWALYNKYLGGRPQEMGHVSMGLMAVTSYLEKRYLSMGACSLVILNFAVVVPFLITKGPTGIAKIIYKDTSGITIAWAYTFIIYILSNVGLWSYVLYRLIYAKDVIKENASSYEPISQGGAL